MEFIDECLKVIGRVNILVHYDPNVKILLNRRLCELVVLLYNVASIHCLPVWKKCEAAIPKCQLALKEFYKQLLLGETLVQSSSSKHFWKLRKLGGELQYLHSCDSALDGWKTVTPWKGKLPLRCDRLKHHVELVDENDQIFVKHSCLCVGGYDGKSVPLRFREGKVISLPCISDHWLKLSIVGAPQGAFVVQFLLDLYWHIIQVNRSLLASAKHEQSARSRAYHRWHILSCGGILSDKYHKYLAAERENGLGSFEKCQEDCELLLKKLKYIADQGPRVESSTLTKEEELHNHRHDIATFVLKQLADRYDVAERYKICDDGCGSPSAQDLLSNKVRLPQYLKIDKKKLDDSGLTFIAQGSSSSVWRCAYLGESLAAKKFKAMSFRDIFPNELETLYKLKHFHIVQLIGYSYFDSTDDQGGNNQLILELMYRDLSRFLKNSTSGAPFPLHVAVDILLQIARGMKYSHDSGVMHRDLKARNILVKRIMSNGNSEVKDLSDDGYCYVKLTDFGFAKKYRETTPMTNVGTSYWRAPEVLGDVTQNYSKPADVYSFAVTCCEVFGGQTPETWMVAGNARLLDDLRKGVRPSINNCPAYLVDYIERCWDTEPGNRPSFVDICVVLLHYKSVLMKPDFDPSADYRISTEEDMIELACQGGLKWLTREVLNHGIDTVDVGSKYSRIPMDVFLDCLVKWEYPTPISSDGTTPPASLSARSANLSAGVELSLQDSAGSLLEGFEKLCIVHYEWQDVLKDLPEAWVHVGDHYASWEKKDHDFENALKWFKKASRHGHPDGFVRVGMCYHSGYGTERNLKLAIQNYEEAATRHSAEGYVYLGLAYAEGNFKEKGLEFWQKAMDYQNANRTSIRIIKLFINIMLCSVLDSHNVYENVVNRLLKMTVKENSIGRKLVAGAAPKYTNVRLVLDAVRKAAVDDKQRATKLLRNLSTEPEVAEKIREAGGAQVLKTLVKESYEPGSKVVPKILVETFCNVIPDHSERMNCLESFHQDDRGNLTTEEIQDFQSRIEKHLDRLLQENVKLTNGGVQGLEGIAAECEAEVGLDPAVLTPVEVLQNSRADDGVGAVAMAD